MAEHQRLLPANATPLELALAEACDPFAELIGAYNSILPSLYAHPVAFEAFIIWQYGLGELTPYVPALGDLITEGIRWQRERGTPASIFRALSWLGYAGAIEEEPVRRRRWNRFQVHLDRVRDHDLPDLRQIDGVVSLSPPIRSKFFRGFHGYDIRACETGMHRLSGCMLSSHSGVRIEEGRAKWSFGRTYEVDHTLDQQELTALGAWVEPVPPGASWAEATFKWADADFPWSLPAYDGRRRTIALAIAPKTPHLRFRAADGTIIGHSFARSHTVRPRTPGAFAMGGSGWDVEADLPAAILVHGRSGFGDGAGQTAATVSVVFDGVRAAGRGPGTLWLGPDELTGGIEVAETPVSIPFGLTVREHVKMLLRFTDGA